MFMIQQNTKARLPRLMAYSLLFLLLAVILVACGGTASQNNLPLPNLDGSTGYLADYEGQTVLVNFWATWCPPCRAEMPDLQAYYDAHKDQGFTLLAVNEGETAGQARAFIEEGGYTFPVILDEDGSIADHFGGLRGMPTTIVLNPDGSVAFTHTGPITFDALEDQVTPLLGS